MAIKCYEVLLYVFFVYIILRRVKYNNNTFQKLKTIFIKIYLTANTISIAMRFYLKQL